MAITEDLIIGWVVDYLQEQQEPAAAQEEEQQQPESPPPAPAADPWDEDLDEYSRWQEHCELVASQGAAAVQSTIITIVGMYSEQVSSTTLWHPAHRLVAELVVSLPADDMPSLDDWGRPLHFLLIATTLAHLNSNMPAQPEGNDLVEQQQVPHTDVDELAQQLGNLQA